MSILGRCLPLAAGLVLWAGSALAATSTFSFPIGAAVLAGGAVISGFTIALPEAGTPNFQLNFILPRDYQRNRAVKIMLYLRAFQPPCAARVVASVLVRERIGLQPTSVSLLGSDSTAVDLPDGAVVAKVFTLRPTAEMAGQRSGDSIKLVFQRRPEDSGDTCMDAVFLHAIDIRYPTP